MDFIQVCMLFFQAEGFSVFGMKYILWCRKKIKSVYNYNLEQYFASAGGTLDLSINLYSGKY